MNLKGKFFCYNERATEEAKSECVPVTMTPAVGQVGQLMDLTYKVPAKYFAIKQLPLCSDVESMYRLVDALMEFFLSENVPY